MIDPEFLSFDSNGLYCKFGNFYLDPQKPVENSVISHAHADHAVSGSQNVFCTDATAAIMQHRYKKNASAQFFVKVCREKFILNGIKVTFFPAGHIVGSVQVLLEFAEIKYLYTGDFKLQPDITCEPAQFVEADVLITESTFADPAITHPYPPDEIKKLNEFDHNVLLGAYSLGKAQRLISLINQHCSNRKILVHHAILPVNKIYEQFSFPPGRYESYNRKLMKAGNNYVYVVPPLTFDSYFRAKNVMRIFASGWKNLHRNNDLELYISDHADWEDILIVINLVKPKQVWTLHGDGSHLKSYFRDKLTVKVLQ